MAETAFARRKEIRLHLDHMSGFRPLNSGRSLFGLGYKCPKYTPLFDISANVPVPVRLKHAKFSSLQTMHLLLRDGQKWQEPCEARERH